MQWNVVVHKETFPYMYRLPLYYFCMMAKILQQTEKWCSNVTMDMWQISFFLILHPSSQKPRTYWIIITFACWDAIYREFFCIWVTLVWPILCIPESYEGMEKCISRRSRNQSKSRILKLWKHFLKSYGGQENKTVKTEKSTATVGRFPENCCCIVSRTCPVLKLDSHFLVHKQYKSLLLSKT